MPWQNSQVGRQTMSQTGSSGNRAVWQPADGAFQFRYFLESPRSGEDGRPLRARTTSVPVWQSRGLPRQAARACLQYVTGHGQSSSVLAAAAAGGGRQSQPSSCPSAAAAAGGGGSVSMVLLCDSCARPWVALQGGRVTRQKPGCDRRP